MDASDVIDVVRAQLFDLNYSGWSLSELLSYLNAAQNRVCFVKPDAYSKRVSLPLTIGVTQGIPDDGIALLDILFNTSTGGTITQVDRELLKAANRFYKNATGSTDIENYATDERTPTKFHVCPPAANGANVTLIYGALPVSATAYDSTLSLASSYEPVLVDGVLAQALMKPSQRQDRDRALRHLSSFNQAIGVKDRMQAVVAPKVGQ